MLGNIILALTMAISPHPATSSSQSPMPSLQEAQAAAQPHHKAPAVIIPRVLAPAKPVSVRVAPAAQPAPPPPTYPYTGSPSTDYITLGRYLVANGYSRAAAAGVAACVAGESAGDPEAYQGTPAGGAGLIQWTPVTTTHSYGATFGVNSGYDWSNQLGAIIRYNNANGPVGGLNSQPDPLTAANYYSQHFERPAITNSDVRPGVAYSVYSALGG